jgi:undecaprenyl-diphosphatase
MTLASVLFLAVLQGLTEFLPISSAAHLILVPHVFGWEDQGLAFDVAVHVGSLVAVIGYFQRELMAMARGWWNSVFHGRHTRDSRLAWAVLFGTIPVALAGLAFAGVIATMLRTPLVIAVATIGFGVVILVADLWGPKQRDEYALTWKDVLVVGIAQALALIPGTSRSGITIAAGLAMGLNREAAARFSFLLSIPVLALAGAYEARGLLLASEAVQWNYLLLATAVSGVVAYSTIHFFLTLVERVGLAPFVIYRLILGAVLLWMFV